MSEITLYLTGIAASLALGAAVAGFIRKPLGLLLTTGFLAMTISSFIRRQERMALKAQQAG